MLNSVQDNKKVSAVSQSSHLVWFWQQMTCCQLDGPHTLALLSHLPLTMLTVSPVSHSVQLGTFKDGDLSLIPRTHMCIESQHWGIRWSETSRPPSLAKWMSFRSGWETRSLKIKWMAPEEHLRLLYVLTTVHTLCANPPMCTLYTYL